MSKETLSTSDKEAPKIKLALEEKYEEEKKNLPPEPEPLTPENIGTIQLMNYQNHLVIEF